MGKKDRWDFEKAMQVWLIIVTSIMVVLQAIEIVLNLLKK